MHDAWRCWITKHRSQDLVRHRVQESGRSTLSGGTCPTKLYKFIWYFCKFVRICRKKTPTKRTLAGNCMEIEKWGVKQGPFQIVFRTNKQIHFSLSRNFIYLKAFITPDSAKLCLFKSMFSLRNSVVHWHPATAETISRATKITRTNTDILGVSDLNWLPSVFIYRHWSMT